MMSSHHVRRRLLALRPGTLGLTADARAAVVKMEGMSLRPYLAREQSSERDTSCAIICGIWCGVWAMGPAAVAAQNLVAHGE